VTAVGATKRVGEIMIPVGQYPSVRDNTTLREAIAVMERAQLEVGGRSSLPRALLVFDEIHVAVGYVRRRDLMLGLEPAFLTKQPVEHARQLFDVAVDPNLSELSYDHMAKGMRARAVRPVSDVMRPIEAILDADDHVMKAVTEMVSLDLSMIPVVQNGQLVGVVRSVDVFHELIRLLP
jgi:predicted transcriptional regulator